MASVKNGVSKSNLGETKTAKETFRMLKLLQGRQLSERNFQSDFSKVM
jgi:hypothetical protein